MAGEGNAPSSVGSTRPARELRKEVILAAMKMWFPGRESVVGEFYKMIRAKRRAR